MASCFGTYTPTHGSAASFQVAFVRVLRRELTTSIGLAFRV